MIIQICHSMMTRPLRRPMVLHMALESSHCLTLIAAIDSELMMLAMMRNRKLKNNGGKKKNTPSNSLTKKSSSKHGTSITRNIRSLETVQKWLMMRRLILATIQLKSRKLFSLQMMHDANDQTI